jgi:hypothetical protein
MESSVLAVREFYRKLAVLAVAVGCMATTCHAPVGFEIRGDLESGVVFGIADLTSGNGKVAVEEVVVGQVAGEEFWRLEGHAELERLVYGEPPAGLTVKAGPLQLKPDHAYYVVVIGDAGWGREAKGTCTFTLNQAGHVQTEPGC